AVFIFDSVFVFCVFDAGVRDAGVLGTGVLDISSSMVKGLGKCAFMVADSADSDSIDPDDKNSLPLETNAKANRTHEYTGASAYDAQLLSEDNADLARDLTNADLARDLSDAELGLESDQELTAKPNYTVNQNFFRFVLPSLAAMLTYTFYTMVDAFFVAHYVGKIGLASVNLAMPFVNGFFALGILFAIGTLAVCSYFLGKNQHEDANRIFSMAFKSALLFTPVLAILCFIFASQIAGVLGAEGVYLPLVTRYLKIVLIFSPCFILAYQLEVMAKADGHPRLAIIGELVAAGTNIFLDWLFVGKLGMGVGGAALATALAQVLMLIIYLIHFIFRSSRLHISLKVSIDMRQLGKMLAMGLGDFFSEIGVGFSIFFYNAFILHYFDEDYLALYSVVAYLGLFVESCFLGVSQGTQPLFSYYCGLKDRKNSQKLLHRSAFVLMGIATLAYALCFFRGDKLFAIFFKLTSAEQATAVRMLRLMALGFFFSAPNNLVASHTVAHLMSKASAWIHLSRTTIFVLLYLFITSRFNPDFIWLAKPLAEATSLCLISIPIFRQRSDYWKDLSERTVTTGQE
ncbi:MAG: MATE family efflux transporter, partial [Eubacteriales bacterium]|nr:MATE family efflux transporter [Eubacteriales bacterium]